MYIVLLYMHTCLEKNFHCLGAGIFRRFVYGIITVVARSTGACIELSNLQDTTQEGNTLHHLSVAATINTHPTLHT